LSDQKIRSQFVAVVSPVVPPYPFEKISYKVKKKKKSAKNHENLEKSPEVGKNQGILRTTKEAPSVQIPDCRLISAAWAAGSPGLVCNCQVGRRRGQKGRKESKIMLAF
jgi:hypothetical protein